MTDRELMQQALDALKTKGEHHPRVYQAIAALREGLAQPKTPDVTPEVTPYVIDCPRCGHCCPQPNQEPVAWRYDQAKYRTNDLRGRQWAFNVFSQTRPYIDEMVQNVTPLYTTPPQQWVGLTDEEIKSLPSWWPSYEDAPALIQLVKDVEAKLKEKNGG
jgi:hypothetical protein